MRPATFKLALRQLGRSPGFTIVALLTLALGIGATVTMFSIVNATLLRPLPYPGAGRLVHLDEVKAGSGLMGVAYPNFVDWKERQDAFSHLALYHVEGRTLQAVELVEQVQVGMVSADFFSVLGCGVLLGRELTAADDRAGADPAVWLTQESWERYFSANPDLIGELITLGGNQLTVAGILPAGFRFQRRAEFYLPIGPHVDGLFMNHRQNRYDAHVIGRLRPGVTLEQARARFEAIGEQLEREHGDTNTGVRPYLEPLRERLAGRTRPQLLLLLGAVGMLLLMTCVNIADMLLARSMAREKEMAVRAALGASRWQLMHQLLAESVVLAAIGGFLGALVGLWGYDFARQLVPWELQTIVGDASGIDWRVLLFSVGVTALTALGFGLVPGLRLSHANPNDALKSMPSTRRTLLGRVRLNDVLVIAQVSLALVLLVGAGLMIRSLYRLAQVDPGFNPAQVLTLEPLPPSFDEFRRDPLAVGRYYEQILDRVQALPAVDSAAFASALPFTGANAWMHVFRLDQPRPAPGELMSASVHTVTPDYFRAMGISLVRGRLLTGLETRPRPGKVDTEEDAVAMFKDVVLEAVVSQRMAERFWPGEDPIGSRFQLDFLQAVVEVVGIVGNTTQNGLDQGEPPEFYLSNRQYPTPMGMHLVVRIAGKRPDGNGKPIDAAALAPMVRAAVQEIAQGRPVLDVRLMAARVDDSMAGRRFNMTLFAFFAAAALLLAVLGVHGVVAFVVSRRTREIGVRMALGASRARVLCDVLWRGLALVGIGIGLGLGGAWGFGRLLESQLFGVTPNDFFTYAVGAAALLLGAVAACVFPARRATRIDPVEALRAE